MNILAAILVLGVLGALFGLVLAVASKIFEVKKTPVRRPFWATWPAPTAAAAGIPAALAAPPPFWPVRPVTACAPAGPENAAAIAEIMGQAAPTGERKVAFVRCNGGTNANKRFEYRGVKDCISATKVAGSPLECAFGCLGFGSCVTACQFGAMSIGPNGTAVVDPDKCTDCMACAAACPRNLIVEVPASKKVHVACANQDKGKDAMSVCSNSCIGCGLCQKECKFDAIHVVNGVAVIDYDKCKGCKLCTKVCPRDAILPIATAEEKGKYKAIKKAQAEEGQAALMPRLLNPLPSNDPFHEKVPRMSGAFGNFFPGVFFAPQAYNGPNRQSKNARVHPVPEKRGVVFRTKGLSPAVCAPHPAAAYGSENNPSSVRHLRSRTAKYTEGRYFYVPVPPSSCPRILAGGAAQFPQPAIRGVFGSDDCRLHRPLTLLYSAP